MLGKLAVSILAFSIHSMTQAEEVKNHSVSLVSAATVVSYENTWGNTEFSGLGISFFTTLHDNDSKQWAARATYAYMKYNNSSAISLHASDFSVVWGSNLNRIGFKWGVGGGLFNERLTSFRSNETFNGVQLTGGLGYNWENVSLAFWMNLRPASAYPGYVNAAANGGLELGYRF